MERDILESLYINYHKAAYIYTFSLCRNKEIAEDIVSEAFERAFTTMDDEKQYFKYWLFVVCKNLWLDYVRKNKYSTSQLLPNKYFSEEEKALSGIVNKEKNIKLYKCIMKLPKNYQEILILHYYGNIPLVDIAKILKISGSNSKTLIYRARVKLKKILEEDDYEF